MAEVTFPAYPGPELEAYVSRLLEEAGVPCFLWGESVLQILRVPTVDFFSAWVVPDNCIEQAVRALDAAKFPPCIQGEECSLFWKHRSHPIPDHHYHTDLTYPEMPDLTCGVYLYKKSRLFWSIPDPVIGPPAPDDPYDMLSSDTRLRAGGIATRGRSPAGKYPVKIIIPARYIVCMLLLKLRDWVSKITAGHWFVELSYLMEYVIHKEDNPALRLDDIAEPWREYFRQRSVDVPLDETGRYDLNYMDEHDIDFGHKQFLRLYVMLKSSGQLPLPEPGRDESSGPFPVEQELREKGIPFDPKIFE
ncbi:uncharacterized protein LDX57_010572 [Aspergillus melleus]|uniref:uncharacterized protein n=1 Tax=Aspergillus melleus TaxID=138277 RepID=UPI001E8E370A|nr:uncharacterized protein LDX57_010572 [Aspergillus melleus]KAH8432939.1 hypothetical protein LDX57_010572 [Aspergillus melleus]